MRYAILDFILALATFAVVAAVAIPLLVLGIELFYAPPYVSLPAVVIGLAAAAYRFFMARRRRPEKFAAATSDQK